MDWLIDWVNNNQNVEHVNLNDYWQGSKSMASSGSVQGAYTLAGKEVIDDFSEQILIALGDDHPFFS